MQEWRQSKIRPNSLLSTSPLGQGNFNMYHRVAPRYSLTHSTQLRTELL